MFRLSGLAEVAAAGAVEAAAVAEEDLAALVVEVLAAVEPEEVGKSLKKCSWFTWAFFISSTRSSRLLQPHKAGNGRR